MIGWVLFSLVGGLGTSGSAVWGQDRPPHLDAFLQALRERSYFDVAEAYLDRLEEKPGSSEELRSELPFLRAQILFEKTRTLTNFSEMRQAWEEASRIAKSELETSTDLPRRLQAAQLITQIHNGLAERQRRQAGLPWERLGESSPAQATAMRQELEQVVATSEKAGELLLEELRESRRSTDEARRARDPEYRRRFLAQLLNKMIALERIALTYPADSEEFKTRMEELVQQNAEYRRKYDKPEPFDMYFQKYQIRALVHLDRWREALPLIDDILFFESISYRDLQREVVLIGFDLWFREEPYKIEMAIEHLDKIVREMTDSDLQSELGQRIQLALAKAHHQRTVFVESIQRPTTQQRTEANASSRLRGEIARRLVRLNTPVAQEARELMASWGLRGPAEVISEVSTFAEARQMGLDLLLQAIELQEPLNGLPAEELATTENLAIREEAVDLLDQALRWLERSLELASSETRRADLNLARLFQCQAYWFKDYYLEAALIGQFLLDRFPNEAGTPEAAALAAQAWNKLAVQRRSEGHDVEAEQRRMLHVGREVLRRWPDRKESGDVAFMLINTELDRRNFVAATEVLAQLSADNPRRGMAELRLGVALVNEAEGLGRLEEPTPEQIEQQSQYRQEAGRMLSAALAVEPVQLTALHMFGTAALAQLLNEQGDFEATLRLLEEPPIAALRRVQQGDLIVGDVNVQTSLIQSGLIAHIGRMGQTGEVQVASDRGIQLLGLLQDKLSANPRGQQIMFSYYSMVLRKLKELAKQDMSSEGRKNLALATVRIFEPVIEPSQDWRLLAVVGESLLDLGSRLPAAESQLKNQTLDVAIRGYEKALELMSRLDGDPSLGNFALSFQLKLAEALRGKGRFEEADSRLQGLLRANPRNTLIQIELSRLYQQWGIATKDRGRLRTAIMGQGRGAEAEIWGWQKLAQATISDAKNSAIFYQALHGLAVCRYHFGVLAGDDKYVESALKAVRDQYERDPQMGGAQWHGQFDLLVQDIQRQLKQPVNGLRGLQ